MEAWARFLVEPQAPATDHHNVVPIKKQHA
jgi:hypothetical protein